MALSFIFIYTEGASHSILSLGCANFARSWPTRVLNYESNQSILCTYFVLNLYSLMALSFIFIFIEGASYSILSLGCAKFTQRWPTRVLNYESNQSILCTDFALNLYPLMALSFIFIFTEGASYSILSLWSANFAQSWPSRILHYESNQSILSTDFVLNCYS